MPESKLVGARFSDDDLEQIELVKKRAKKLNLTDSDVVRWAVRHLAQSLTNPDYVFDPMSGAKLGRADLRANRKRAE